MKAAIDDFMKHSPFVLVFFNDEPAAFLVRNWEALLSKLKSQLWDGAGSPPDWDELIGEMSDPDEWATDAYGPWHYTTDIGEGRMTVFRLIEGE